MRRIFLTGVGLVALSGPARAAGVPVVDIVANTNNMINWGTSIANQVKEYALQMKQFVGEEMSWATQAQQYYMQGQQYLVEAEQLASFVHSPNLGAAMGLLNQAGLGNSLPVSPYSVMGLVNGTSYGGGGLPQIQGVLGSLSGFASSSYTANHVYTPNDGTWVATQTIARANSIAGMQGAAQASVADYQAHQAAFQAVQDRLATAKTPKDVQDAQAQIALQQTWYANEAGQMQAVTAAYQAQRDADVQKDNERLKQSFNDFINSN
jgi:hypothetical protein